MKISMSFLDQLLTNPPSQDDQNDKGEYSLALEYIHRFLVFAFASTFSDGEPVDSIIEQITLLTSFNPTEGWRDASAIINGVLKALQHVSRVVSVHSAFLGGTSSTYVPLIDNNSCTGDKSDDGGSNDSGSGDSDSDDGSAELIDFSVIAAISKSPPTSDSHGVKSEETERLLQCV